MEPGEYPRVSVEDSDELIGRLRGLISPFTLVINEHEEKGWLLHYSELIDGDHHFVLRRPTSNPGVSQFAHMSYSEDGVDTRITQYILTQADAEHRESNHPDRFLPLFQANRMLV